MSEALLRSIAVVTLGSGDLERSVAFYRDGFGWTPEFRNDSVAFYQLNGFVFGLFARAGLDADMNRTNSSESAAFSLAHNVAKRDDVAPVLARLMRAGGHELQPASEPQHGGYRGYVADPDGHAWEIAWNPHWPIDAEGRVKLVVPED